MIEIDMKGFVLQLDCLKEMRDEDRQEQAIQRATATIFGRWWQGSQGKKRFRTFSLLPSHLETRLHQRDIIQENLLRNGQGFRGLSGGVSGKNKKGKYCLTYLACLIYLAPL